MIAKAAFMIIILMKSTVGIQMQTVEFKDMESCKKAESVVDKMSFIRATCIEK